MKTHIVTEKECIATIARRYDVRPWTLIYDAAENAEFRRKRPNPNVIHAGDELVIPDVRKKQESGATENRHRFRIPKPRQMLRIRFRDEAGNPLDDFAWRLTSGDAVLGEGRTDPDGLLEVPLDDAVSTAVLEMGGYVWPLSIDRLDPVTRITGVQQRLSNLGHDPGPIDGIVGPLTTAAVMAFQASTDGLEPTGEIDDATRRALLSEHDQDTALGAAEEDMSARSEQAQAASGETPAPGGIDEPRGEGIEPPYPCEPVEGWASLTAPDEMERTLGVQQRLWHLGIDPGPFDGISGPLTRAAVTEFQILCAESAGTPPEIIDSGPVDGIVGPLTTAALDSAAGRGPGHA